MRGSEGIEGRASWAEASTKRLRVRATIIVDFDARDAVELEQAKTQLIAQHELVRTVHPGAQLEFRKRKPRQRPRASAPARIMQLYVDD